MEDITAVYLSLKVDLFPLVEHNESMYSDFRPAFYHMNTEFGI